MGCLDDHFSSIVVDYWPFSELDDIRRPTTAQILANSSEIFQTFSSHMASLKKTVSSAENQPMT